MNDFKKGDVVTCIDNDNGGLDYLTYGKDYVVQDADEGGNFIKVIDDEGDVTDFWMKRFKKKVESVDVVVSGLSKDGELVVNAQGGMKAFGGKLDYTLLPWTALRELVSLMMFGQIKYERNNWMKVDPEEYKKALLRHVALLAEGEWLDTDSKHSHCSCIMFNAMVLIWFKLNGKLDE